MFDMNTTDPRIGIATVHSTVKGPMLKGPIIFLVMLGVILIGGAIGLLVVFKDH